jgi:alpha-mannosidase
LYRPLGMGFVTAKEPHLPPQPGQAVFSTEQAGAPGTVTRGPVYSEFTVAHPFGERGRFQTTIRLYAGLPRVEIRTRLLNHDAHVRYRVLFPTSLAQGRSVHEIPFGAIERPDGVECPAQNWIDHSDGDRGVALLNRGLPGNNVSGGTMMLSLMRSTQIVSYGLSGGYEGQNSSSGLELGKELTFDYALLPHAGDWRQAAVYQSGHEFNHPLVAATAAAHPGRLPRRWGFLELSHPNVMVSALKTAEDGHGAVLRIYETTGAAVAGARIKFAPAITSAVEVNLMEDPIRELVVGTDNTVQVGLRPFEIKTIRLVPNKA